MKVRVLYPTAVNVHIKEDVDAGGTVTLDDDLAHALMRDGAVEPMNAARVERATAAPGERRRGRPRKNADSG